MAKPIGPLEALRQAEAACTRCPLYRDATQVVPGEGPARAKLLVVGEQPGHHEDLAGRPFVGPAGRLLDRTVEEAGIDRRKVFITNAVKHFKFEPRGKRRLHKRPNAYEIERCRWWLDQERSILKPRLFLALGATAARSLFGRPVAVAKVRGQVLSLPEGEPVVTTIHPSYLLRIDDDTRKAAEYERFLADLRMCAKALAEGRR